MEKSYIPKGMIVIGDVESDGDLLLAGEVQGNVSIGGNLELNGVVRGDNLKVGSISLSEGTIESSIECAEDITVGPDVKVIGNVKAKNATIEGGVKGDLNIAESLTIGEHAVLKGGVATKDISIAKGALCEISLNQIYADRSAEDFFAK